MNPIHDRLLDLARTIQQIPAPTFAERARAEFLLGLFRAEGLGQASMDEVGNVYACLPGRSASSLPPLVVSAHLDTVFPPGADLQIREAAGRIHAPGIGDNSLGVAALMGLAWSLKDRGVVPDRPVWLVGDVGEEGLGDLRGMRAVADRFGPQADGFLVLEGLALGHVYHRGVGVRRYRIQVSTAGGHSWSDFGQPSAVHELAHLVTRLSRLHLPREPRTTLNVGVLRGGTGVNVIAAEAACELDLRSEENAGLERVDRQLASLVRHANRPGIRATLEVIGQRPVGGIPEDHPMVTAAVESTRRIGLEAVLTCGSTDANIPLSRGLPAVVMGITSGGGAHTLQEYIDTDPVGRGMACIVDFVLAWCNREPVPGG